LSEYQRAKNYITAEQAYFQQKARQLGPLQQQLLSELRQHIKQHQVSLNLLMRPAAEVNSAG
jgi:protease II